MKRLFLNLIIIFILLSQFDFIESTCMLGYTESIGLCDECGIRFENPNAENSIVNKTKIVGGIIAKKNSWPAQVLIFKNLPIGKTFICGGTLIKRNFVLTAAHCVYDSEPSDFEIYLGVHNRSLLNEPGIVKHSSYDPDIINDDIALLELYRPIELSTKIQIACLPQIKSKSFPFSTINSYAVGWGNTKYLGNQSDTLRNVKLNIYDGAVYCHQYTDTDWDKQICAGEYEGGKDTCQCDSGGPLYVLEKIRGKYKYILAGITSYGEGCGLPGYPGIYTRVSAYMDWIETNSLNRPKPYFENFFKSIFNSILG